MQRTQVVRCPNCGSWAERCYFTGAQAIYQKCPSQRVAQTECQTCDYLMVMCSINGRVIEAYSSGREVPAAEVPARKVQVAQRTQQSSQSLQVTL